MKKSNPKMQALMELRKVIDAMLGDDFDTRRKPALMAMKVSKTEVPLEEVVSEDDSHEMPDGEIMADSKMLPEVEVLEGEPEVEMEVVKSVPCECGKPDCDCSSEEMPEEDSDAVKKLRALLGK